MESPHSHNDPDDQPFRFTNPKLVSQKLQTQVVLCDAFDTRRETEILCILKFFSPRANVSYNRELAVYSTANSSTVLQESVLLKLWSGIWTKTKYLEFLADSLPTLLQKKDQQISVIALPYIRNTDSIFNGPEELRLFLTKAALYSLRHLHTNRITHGDISVSNLLIERQDDYGYSTYWIDFSSSTVEASAVNITYEWEKAVDYFSNLVYKLFYFKEKGADKKDKSRCRFTCTLRGIGTEYLPTGF